MRLKVYLATTARSDYAALGELMRVLAMDRRFDASLVVSGSHLSAQHGSTVEIIERDGWPIADRIDFLAGSSTTAAGHGVACGVALREFGRLLSEHPPDVLVICGDRFELMPIATAAMLASVPIAHISGGDVTEGAIDEQVRHAVTKMAHLHFPHTPLSARRVLQMGEEPWRVVAVGDPTLDAFVRGEKATVAELERDLGFVPDRSTLVVTFHPTTLELAALPLYVEELMAALRGHEGRIVITAPAPDPGAEIIRAGIDAFTKAEPRALFVPSLGTYRYRGLLTYGGALVGNSSSALIEAPVALTPAVNVGDRQKGRERARNVVDVPPEREAIARAIRHVLTPTFRDGLRGLRSPYGNGNASAAIANALAAAPPRAMLLRKAFTLVGQAP